MFTNLVLHVVAKICNLILRNDPPLSHWMILLRCQVMCDFKSSAKLGVRLFRTLGPGAGATRRLDVDFEIALNFRVA